MTNCTHHKMSARLSIYNACILFCDRLKITKQITQNTQIQVQASYLWPLSQKQNQKGRTYLADSYTFVSVIFHNIITFLCWFVFLVFNTLQQKQGAYFLLISKIIDINYYSDRCNFRVTVMSQCLLWSSFDILLAHAVHRWISFLGNKNSV